MIYCDLKLSTVQIFAKSGVGCEAGQGGEAPDSTTWQQEGAGQATNTSPDSSQSFAKQPDTAQQHFPSDTTLNCFQVT